jgi:beta-xylosidase
MVSKNFYFLCIVLVLHVSCCTASHHEIVPGATWTVRNTGRHLQAHGGGIIWHQADRSYYLIGENKTANPNSNLFQSVACYKSTDLVNWEFVNDLLSSTTTGDFDLHPSMIIERPKVIYNAATKKYVLWMHVDNSGYSYARAGVAYSDTVCGDYTYIESVRPLGNNTSRDITAWVDQDGAGYLISEASRSAHQWTIGCMSC